jgi:hypothetical protein
MANHDIAEWAAHTGHGETLARATDFSGIVISFFDATQTGLARYGFTNTNSSGSTSEHRASLEALQETIRSPANPFNIEDNVHYVATQQDLQDSQYLLAERSVPGFDGPVSVYDAFVPAAAPVPVTPPVVAPSNPTTPFQAATDRQLLEEILVQLSGLRASLEGQEPGLWRVGGPPPVIPDPSALAKGGVALDALKALLASPEMHQATGGDKYQALKKKVLQAGAAVDQAT